MMRGFVLAAGFGTRMRPLTDHIPKALIPVCGKPLLERALNFLNDNGITEIGVNAHYLPHLIEQYREKAAVPFTPFIEEGKIRGTGGAFFFARSFLIADSAFLMQNVDIVCKYDLRAAIQMFMKSDSICTLIAFPCDKGKGTIYFDKSNLQYLGTPSDSTMSADTGEAAFIGAALYRKEFLDIVTPDDFSIVPVWKRAVNQGRPVMVNVQKNGFWRDVGTIQALADIHFDVFDNNVDLDIPSHLKCNFSEKFCIPAVSNATDSTLSGSYAWIESEQFEGSVIQRSLIWPQMDVRAARFTNSIVTPWGVHQIS